MLTEKEIEEILRKYEYEADGQTVGGMDVIYDVFELEQAAAAIAQRLSEGVVWSGVGEIHNGNRASATVMPLARTVEEDDFRLHWYGKCPGDDGQLVEVTVKIVEGTKDGS